MDIIKNGKKINNLGAPHVREYDIPTVRLFREKLLESSQYEKPVTDVYDVFDNDLARDNMENDMTAAEIEEMHRLWP